jgi:hypothetical protein
VFDAVSRGNAQLGQVIIIIVRVMDVLPKSNTTAQVSTPSPSRSVVAT